VAETRHKMERQDAKPAKNAKLRPVHTAQLLSYLRTGEFQLGLLFNFNVYSLRHGIRRVVWSGSPTFFGVLGRLGILAFDPLCTSRRPGARLTGKRD
jgi:hypothetical protein